MITYNTSSKFNKTRKDANCPVVLLMQWVFLFMHVHLSLLCSPSNYFCGFLKYSFADFDDFLAFPSKQEHVEVKTSLKLKTLLLPHFSLVFKYVSP